MIYSLHPEAESDLREAADYYRERAGITIAQAFFSDFEQSITLLLEYPLLGALWLPGKLRLVMKARERREPFECTACEVTCESA